MTDIETTSMPTIAGSIAWRPFPGFDGLYYWVLDVDRDRQVVDMLMRFDSNATCVPHRHVGPTRTLVIEGEHILFEPDDVSSETARKVAGQLGISDGDAHIEGGASDGAIILLTMTAVDGVVYEIFDDRFEIVERTITLDDFERGLRKQAASPRPTPSA